MSNLLKRGTTITKDERVIDYNELIRQKLNKMMETKPGSVDPDGFVNGLQADVVEELIGDDTENAADTLTDDAQGEQQPSGKTLEEANAEAEKIISEAQSEADRIIAEAKESAENIAIEARQNGYNDGMSSAEADKYAQIESYEKEYNERKQQLEEEYEQKRDQIEPELVDVITEVFRQVTHVVSEDNKDIILELINGVMRGAESSREYLIKVSPDDYNFLINNQGKIYSAMSKEVNIDIIVDSTLERNQCMIETPTGIFNCSLDVELDNIIRDIKLLSCI